MAKMVSDPELLATNDILLILQALNTVQKRRILSNLTARVQEEVDQEVASSMALPVNCRHPPFAPDPKMGDLS